MINRLKKSKKSTSKKRPFGVSPLIPAIAIIEVLVLIAVSTYAWFFVQASKIIGSGTISVAADSGLDIDFQYSNVDDYINIWNYVGSDFTFEPASSLDGRAIYFPTSGTFANNTTDKTVFRDGTVNDINSKYLSIDFELTNTSDYNQYVYLNNNSYFRVQEKNSSAYEESRALRLAFYQNDGSSGNVGSSLLNSDNGSSDGDDDTSLSDADYYTFYFDAAGNSDWKQAYAYFYNSGGSYYSAWPGVPMSNKNGLIYALSMKKTDLSSYDKVIFNNGSGGTDNQTSERNITSCAGKAVKMYTTDLETLYWQTVYFVKPYAWGTPKCKTYKSTSGTGDSYSDEDMTYVGSGIYSYTYYYQYSENGGALKNNIRRLQFHNGNNWGGDQQTAIISVSGTDKRLYYTNDQNVSDNTYYLTYYCRTGETATLYDELNYQTIYLFNTHSWDKPYATVGIGSGSTPNTCDLALVTLSGNVYYCNVPECYTNVYFRSKNQATNYRDDERTAQAEIVDEQVYRPKSSSDENPKVYDNGHNYWALNTFMYDKYIKSDGYPVISPGVSVGFQRPYSPVITIDAYSGAATEIVPAYSNSIDNYILHSDSAFVDTEQELFILESNHMVSLSMIMWLEGTDEACTGESYAGKQIDMRLEFSTKYVDSNNAVQVVNAGDSNSYIYNFYDRTREIWTSDRQSTESGVTVEPVMQLYDNTIKRGYKMAPADYRTYNGKQKVSCWSVTAPQSIALRGHDIIFRRVNPYNEDEVWNYWHAGPVAGTGRDPTTGEYPTYNSDQSVYSIALGTDNGETTVNFTAFSDGSPTEDNLLVAKYNQTNGTAVETLSSDTLATLKTTHSTYLSNASVPVDSCGGLWGDHAVSTLTLLDATDGHYFLNDHGVMTMNYSYPYTVGGTTKRTVNIEYKASDDYGMMFYFIVPNTLYSENNGTAVVSDVKFKRYYNFNYTGVTYAINSEKNNKILFENKWNAGTAKGMYYEIGQNYNSSHNLQYYSYWGSDILYVQTNNTSNPYLTTGANNMIQLEFYKSSNTSTHKYVVCFAEQHFKGTDSNSWGYTAIVPCDADYNRYQVQYCATNGGGKVYRSSSDKTVYTSSVSSNTSTIDYRNTLFNTSTRVSEHICQIDYFENIRIYFESNVGTFKNSNGQFFYAFGGSAGPFETWPGDQMTWRSDPYNGEYKRFYYVINPNNYKKFIVSCNPNGSWQAPEASFTPEDNCAIYQCYNDNGSLVVRKNGNYDVDTGVDRTKVMHLTLAEAIDWPHYSVQ